MLCCILNIHTLLEVGVLVGGWEGRRKSRKQRPRELGGCLESVKYQDLSCLIFQRSLKSIYSQNLWTQLPVHVYCWCQAHKELLVLSQSWGCDPKTACTLGKHSPPESRLQSMSDWFPYAVHAFTY